MHSVFERAVNLRCHDGRLVMLQGLGLLSAPFAAAVEWLPPAGTLAAGMAVMRDGTRLLVGGVSIDWRGADVAATAIAPAARLPRALAALFDHGEAPHGAPRLESERGGRGRERLADGIGRADSDAFLDGVRALIGLGEGLTPAGDDCVVGALAMLRRLRPEFLARRPALRQQLATAARGATTDVGREFLLHALDGAFSEPMIALLMAASEAKAREGARRLLSVGRTSGADALLGMRLAWRALHG